MFFDPAALSLITQSRVKENQASPPSGKRSHFKTLVNCLVICECLLAVLGVCRV